MITIITYPRIGILAPAGDVRWDYTLEHPALGLARPMPMLAGFVVPARLLAAQDKSILRRMKGKKDSRNVVEVSVNM